MSNASKELFSNLAAPAMYAGMVAAVQLLAHFGILPPPAGLVEILGTRLGDGSLWFVAICAFLENIAVVTVYFPGSVVILFSMAQSHGNKMLAVKTWAVIYVCASLAYCCDYGLGRLAKRPDMKPAGQIGSRKEVLLGLLAYWHPHVGSIFAYHQGRSRKKAAAFMTGMLVSWGAWSTAWGALMYHIGRLRPSGQVYVDLVYVCLAVWVLYEVVKFGVVQRTTGSSPAAEVKRP